MSFVLWLKNLFTNDTVELPEELKEEMQQEASKDYKFRIFEVNNKHELNPVTSFIVNDKSLALIKMHKFTGDTNELKETLMELKQVCSNCNSSVFGVSNNMFLVVKNSVEVVKE